MEHLDDAPWKNLKMKKIRILIIGRSLWLNEVKKSFEESSKDYAIEVIEDEDEAISRLTHNSYDILVINEKFSNLNSIELASLAYAMTRPTIITCSNVLSYICYTIWHHFSRFSNRFKTSKKLIYFNYKFKNINSHIKFLSQNYAQYFNVIKEEIKNNTSI